jgi:hypothetical protein
MTDFHGLAGLTPNAEMREYVRINPPDRSLIERPVVFGFTFDADWFRASERREPDPSNLVRQVASGMRCG